MTKAKDFITQVIEKLNELYLEPYQKIKTILAKRLEAFEEIETNLQALAKIDKEEDQKLLQRDESYILLPLDTDETLALLHDWEGSLRNDKE